ncbi:BatD family protein [Mariniblastus fucicola]|uniref:Uncharacterized protein n=1 Tax=Mariniblastus fucicola TaxID=980251 RepID=A0A5B9PE54_9BACT|nr:BatD family protein [Mariniblastus fucicola]QEG24688.1 hypothetical protein MFFC18_46090 [Mariniblastus fucicola]
MKSLSSVKLGVRGIACCMLFIAMQQSVSYADTFGLVRSADRTSVLIADPFRFEISLTAPADSRVSFSELGEKVGSFDVLDVNDQFGIPIEGDANRQRWIRTLTLETIDTGKLDIPQLEVSVQEPGGDSKLLRSEPLQITVVSVVESSADLTTFNDIADLIEVDEPESTSMGAFWISLVGGITLAIAAACLIAARQSKTPVSASVWALARLNDRTEGSFNRVESILRDFIEERFDFPAASLSSSKIAETLASKNVASDSIARVEEILSVSERVKFGGLGISTEVETRLTESARKLIVDLEEVISTLPESREAA